MSVLGHIHDWIMHKGGFLIFLFLKISADTECLNIVCLVNHLNVCFLLNQYLFLQLFCRRATADVNISFCMVPIFFLSFFFFFLYHSTIK